MSDIKIPVENIPISAGNYYAVLSRKLHFQHVPLDNVPKTPQPCDKELKFYTCDLWIMYQTINKDGIIVPSDAWKLSDN